MCEDFNNAIKNMRLKALAIIKQFYEKNYSLMVDLVPKSKEEMWRDTYPFIIDDLSSGGNLLLLEVGTEE